MLKRTATLFFATLVLGGCFQVSAQDISPSPVTKQALEKHLTELQEAQRRALAEYQALSGAVQECKYWIGEIDKAEAEKEAEKKPKNGEVPKPAQEKKKDAK